MEDDSYSDEETRPTTSAPRKRKSDPGRRATSTTKRARTATTKKEAASNTPVIDANARSLVADVLKNAQLYQDGDGDLGTTLVTIATYARQLENMLAAGSASSQTAAKKSPEQVQAAADKLRNAAVSGIKKQMSWKPSCKTGTARFIYDGVCADHVVFGALMGLDGPPAWKMKKMSKEAFEDLFGAVVGSVRYDDLYITSQVNIRWTAETGEFKISGSYGKSQYKNED